MADRKLQELEDAMRRLKLLDDRQQDDMFDYKAGLISLDELMSRQTRVTNEKNDIINKEVMPLEQSGYHCTPACVKLPDGSLKQIGYLFHADGKPWPPND